MEIQAIEKWLIEKATAYYEGRRLVSDAQFDAEVARLRELSPSHPYLTTPGWGYAPKDGIRHKIQIKEDMVRCAGYKDFISRFDGGGQYKIVPKIDGITVVLYCVGYRFEKMLTRGNGMVGRPVTVNLAEKEKIEKMCRLLDPFRGEGAIICSACLPSEKEFGKARDNAAEMIFLGSGDSNKIKFFPHSLLTVKNGVEQTNLVNSEYMHIAKIPTENEVKVVLNQFQAQGYDCDGIVLENKSNRYVHYC